VVNSQIIILFLVVSLFFGVNSAFADPHTIETADNDLAVPGCLETQVGCYTPNTTTVDVGHIVTMTNTDSTGIHTFTSGTVDGFAPSPDGIFDSGMLMKPGDSFEYTATTAGNFPYYCTLHVWMQGVLIVQEAEVIPPSSSSGNINVSGTTVSYSIIGGQLQSIMPDEDANSLIISITATDNGSLTLTIPRTVLDSLLGNGYDDDFFVLVDDKEVDFDETTTSTDRTLTIAFPTRTEQIEIIGTGGNTISPSPTISIWSGKSSYTNGDSVTISGNIKNYDPSLVPTPAVSYVVITPDGKDRIGIGQLVPNSDGSFQFSFVAGGPLWKLNGNYIVESRYSVAKSEITINYVGGEQVISEPPSIQNSIVITTDKTDYTRNDIILVTGEVRYLYSRTPVSIIVVSPLNSIVTLEQLSVANDGSFETSFNTANTLWKYDGTYTIKVNYGSAETSTNTKVELTGGVTYEPEYSTPTFDTTPPKILKPTDITVDAENPNSTRVSYDVLVIDDTDQLIRPTCNPSSGTMFSVGTTRVTCNAMDSSGNRASAVSFSITVNPPKVGIPDWVKNVALFWCEDKIEDASFIGGIQYLIENNIIIVSASSSGFSGTNEIPNWIKNTACWWSEGLIEDSDFASGIVFLVNHGIIRV